MSQCLVFSSFSGCPIFQEVQQVLLGSVGQISVVSCADLPVWKSVDLASDSCICADC